MKTTWLLVNSFCLVAVVGCDGQRADPPKERIIQQVPVPQAIEGTMQSYQKTMPNSVKGEVLVPAEAGVGGKGADYGEGFVTTPLKSYFRTQEKIDFFALKKTEDIYRGINGHMPKTHEEYQREIIDKGQIKLPQLPPGHRYVYSPERQQLMVRKPK